jgi:uncharacterized phage protein (TIGR02218 family)
VRTISAALQTALRQDAVNIADLIELTTPTQTYRWTTSNIPIVSSLQTYDPFPGRAARGAEESTDLGIGYMDFSVVNSGQIKELIDANQLDFASVVISRVVVNSPDIGRLYMFRGKVADLSFTRDLITGQIRNIFNGVTGTFPYNTYKETCDWRFGSTGCGINTSSYTISSSIAASSSNPLILLATSGGISVGYAPGRLDRGRLTVLTGANSGQVRTIRACSGDLMILSHPLPFSVSSGFSFSVHPGCRKRVVDDCRSLYNNVSRALGFPWMPKNEQAF